MLLFAVCQGAVLAANAATNFVVPHLTVSIFIALLCNYDCGHKNVSHATPSKQNGRRIFDLLLFHIIFLYVVYFLDVTIRQLNFSCTYVTMYLLYYVSLLRGELVY